MTHNKGPWIYEKEIVSYGIRQPGGYFIAETLNGMEESAHEANARLIAAAPDLLESAKLLIDSYDICRKDRTPDVIFERLRAAIAKATGETL